VVNIILLFRLLIASIGEKQFTILYPVYNS